MMGSIEAGKGFTLRLAAGHGPEQSNPMLVRRLMPCFLALFVAFVAHPAARGDAALPAATASSLCDALLDAMKKGASLDFAGRVKLLGPTVRNDFDLALMTRIVVGPTWRSLAPKDQELLVDAFSDYSIATYAERFKSFSSEHFEVDPKPTTLPSGDAVVHTKLFTGGSDSVQLDYMMRKTGDQWRIIDIFLSGTISELAARRSEYSTVLREGGAPALVALLQKKTTELGGKS
jgi:phospholipid transport system substrate-binding protein